ncbi:hypothetical protein H0H81_006839, partial [Sphagnurus paluster]
MDSRTSLLHKIEFIAGTSNTIVLSRSERQIALYLISSTEDFQDWYSSDEERLERLRVAVAPHKQLPVELLSVIFALSIPSLGFTVPPTSRKAPWSLRSVCSLWRKVVLRDPHLWNNLEILIPNRWQNAAKATVIEYLQHLQRDIMDPEAPISLRFYGSESDLSGSFVPSVYDHFLQPNLHRFRHIFVKDHQAIVRILRIPGSSFTNLESLTILSSSYETTFTVERPAALFKDLQSLRRLTFELFNYTHLMDFTNTTMPWRQLTHLTITPPPKLAHYAFVEVTNALEILRQCESLVHFKLGIAPFALAHNKIQNIAISVPTLRTFELRCFTPVSEESSPMAQFFGSLHFPALVELRVHAYNDPTQFGHLGR